MYIVTCSMYCTYVRKEKKKRKKEGGEEKKRKGQDRIGSPPPPQSFLDRYRSRADQVKYTYVVKTNGLASLSISCFSLSLSFTPLLHM